MFVRSPYNYDVAKVSEATGLRCTDKSRTRSDMAEGSDINVIVGRFIRTGGGAIGAARAPEYGDYSEVVDFQSANNAIIAAWNSFMELPAATRKRFGNDPGEFLAFCSIEENRPEAERLGIVMPKVVAAPPEPVSVRIVNQEPAKPA